ncbi:3' terminal RNA ribose 2'-O-methyltransferase Hen1 [Rhodococcus sp. IEGM 1379]|uniref:3' terminal RNA ribose 2'-O-methyltransferase Hen1 n=1 Tax=Rhodococcus sp. IEGM 1379 TaxID=3047086 RepID=UPI0024B76404|nr:3' terminal RNA ribose 2'-O-methyltransferase Hen1 [Rhodococcus sp. IEGM 1379]MDI9915830.1 3' terminal RNA ribose 2'-O-methyltransferase Hen1 [Rhodococcus sp. IEGM 1379]
MLLTLTSTPTSRFPDATALSFLLHKHPDKVQTFDLSVGKATVLYPNVGPEETTVALIVDVDPIELVQNRSRRGKGNDSFALGQYVNDRPYAASSILAVALSKLFRTALAGTCTSHPELVDAELALTVSVPVVPVGGDTDLPRRLFEPLGWDVTAVPVPLDPHLPDWGDSNFVSLTLTGEHTVQSALRHLYVLLPVLDDVKHYWVGSDEADKLVRVAGEWLATHPEASLIMSRYLARQRDLVESVVDRLVPDAAEPVDELPRPEPPLARLRTEAVVEALRQLHVRRVVDIGCGEGKLIEALMPHAQFDRLVGIDVSARELARADRRLKLAELSDFQRERVSLMQSSATYRDSRLKGFDAAVLMEVVEHVDATRLPALVRSVFADAAPQVVLLTTPNSDYNALYPALGEGEFRHPDHRFEFSRAQFEEWAADIATAHGYSVQFSFVGSVDPTLGGPTQMAIFKKEVGTT